MRCRKARLRFTGMLLSLKNRCPIISGPAFASVSERRGEYHQPGQGFYLPAYEHQMPGNSASGTYSPDADNFLHAFAYSVTRSLTG